MPVVIVVVLLFPSFVVAGPPIGYQLVESETVDGSYISWRKHIIDSAEIAGFELTGSDDLLMADIDGDGQEGIVSVHESVEEYDSRAFSEDGYVPDDRG